MASIVQRIQTFLRSPQGKRVVQQAQYQLSKPDNQRKLKGLLTRLKGRRR